MKSVDFEKRLGAPCIQHKHLPVKGLIFWRLGSGFQLMPKAIILFVLLMAKECSCWLVYTKDKND
jgi:hypothetical protein